MNKASEARKERLAAALRENLKRRKARARALKEKAAKAASEGEPGTEAPLSRRQDAAKRV